MDHTVVIRIQVANGGPVEIEKPLPEARSFSEQVAATGYLDPATGAFFPPESILKIEVSPHERFGEGWFSEN